MTAIVDYGAGNLRSVQNTLDELGAAYIVTNRPEEVSNADKLLLPGVGHFGQMMTALDGLDLRNPIIERVRAGVPLLGICLGLQCMFEKSSEAPGIVGFGPKGSTPMTWAESWAASPRTTTRPLPNVNARP
jgi:imidazole glycerol phosphate synthase glutamine amidotransferase subunit